MIVFHLTNLANDEEVLVSNNPIEIRDRIEKGLEDKTLEIENVGVFVELVEQVD